MVLWTTWSNIFTAPVLFLSPSLSRFCTLDRDDVIEARCSSGCIQSAGRRRPWSGRRPRKRTFPSKTSLVEMTTVTAAAVGTRIPYRWLRHPATSTTAFCPLILLLWRRPTGCTILVHLSSIVLLPDGFLIRQRFDHLFSLCKVCQFKRKCFGIVFWNSFNLAPKPVGRRHRRPGSDRKPRQAYSVHQLEQLESEFKVNF